MGAYATTYTSIRTRLSALRVVAVWSFEWQLANIQRTSAFCFGPNLPHSDRIKTEPITKTINHVRAVRLSVLGSSCTRC